MTVTAPSIAGALPTNRDEVVRRAKELRPFLADAGPSIDAEGSDPTHNMRLLGEAGLQALNVPAELGGLWDGPSFGGWRHTIETLTEISAGDGSTGQCWLSGALVAREVFQAQELPSETREQLADEVL